MAEESHPITDKGDNADTMDELTREERPRQPTFKALMNDIDKAQKALHQSWKGLSEQAQILKATSDDIVTLRHNLAVTQATLQSYRETWSKLELLYEKDKTGDTKDERMRTKLTVLENTDMVNTTIAQSSERAYQLTLEMKSTCSQRPSNASTSSRQSIKAQAMASAAAAAENAKFEETIAKRTADHKIKQAQREVEEKMEQATAEAELQILKAQKSAAVEQSRANVLLQMEEENMTCLTSPQQSSNDHALQFVNQRPTPMTTPHPTAPVFVPASSFPQSHSPSCPIERTLPVHRPSQNANSPIQTRQSDEGSLLAVTREITNTLAHQRQPTQEPDVYGGDPIMFHPWRASFITMVNQAPTPATQKLAFLSKYTKGEVKKLVDRFRHRYVSSPDTAYKEAWRELEERFGNKTKITTEVLRRLMDFPRFKAGENKKLQELADLCADIAAQMEDLPDLSVLNYSHNLHPVLDKLPQHLHNTWRKRASHYKTDFERYPPFTMLAEFLVEKAKMHNDPELYPTNQAMSTSNENSMKNRTSLRVMATASPSAKGQDPQHCLHHDKQGHHISDCIAFGRKPIQERRDFCRSKGLCFKCGNKHRIKDCTSAVQCKKCRETDHASFMHSARMQDGQQVNPEKPKDTVAPSKPPPSSDANTKCTRFLNCPLARSCSKIVLCKIYHQERPQRSIDGYVILDDQSNACLASPKVFDTLDLMGPTYPYELSTCNGNGVITEGRRASGLIVESSDGKKESLPTVVENSHIPGDKNEIPGPEICSKFPHLKSLANKIPELKEDVDIVLLIGRNCPEPLKVRESRNGPRGTPWAQRTDLGWTVSGQVCMAATRGRPHISVSRTTLQQPPASSDFCENHIHVREFPSVLCHSDATYSLYKETSDDSIKALSVEDRRFLDIMTKGAHTNAKGNLEFPLPFKSEQVILPNNRLQAESRFNNLMRSLRKKPETMKRYITFFEKILAKNHASLVPKEELTTSHGAVWYLPHFAVQHPRKPDIRVVFDASAEFAGSSLNNMLLQGPDHMNSLLGILLRFRLNEVALMGDVEQMFHNFHVSPEHRDFLRFLWFERSDPEGPTAEFRMNVHLFGNVSSPAVATFGLRMIANECAPSQGQDVKEFIHNDFYVDDGLTSVPDSHTALSLIQRTREALATKNLRFHKLASNDREVMNALPEEARAKDLQNLDYDNDELPTQRSLGVCWSLKNDCFTFRVIVEDKPFSRRGVLSTASSIFDPLGFVAPITVEGKIILREINMKMKKETNVSHDTWDKPLPDEYLPRWLRWRNSLHQLEDIRIQRCYQPPGYGPVRRRELHVFSDASLRAIGAVAYLRLINEDGEPHVSFLMAKAKVTPSHAVSVPRLELCAAVLATTLAQTAVPEFDRVAIDDVTYYTDSKVVIGYIANESKRFHTYVANRVHNIHKVSRPSQWRHVSTDENPADIASRSVPANQLNSTFWFKGPKFLWQRDPIPKEVIEIFPNGHTQLAQDDPEVKKRTNILATNIADDPQDVSTDAKKQGLTCERFSRFSTWISLRRAVATLVAKARTYKVTRRQGAPPKQADDRNLQTHARFTLDDLQRSERLVLRAVQESHFAEEMTLLKSAPGSDQTQAHVKKKIPMYQLDPFLDEDGLLRVGGRLRRADLDLGGRHPIVLPKNTHVSKLVIEHFHRETEHLGRHMTLAAVRNGGMWIIGAHSTVRSIIHHCTTCRRLRGKPLSQIMADLPSDRLQMTPPFTNVGMDVFGPWTVMARKTRGGQAESKRWAVIFTCLCTRAVHIEVIETMDTSSFISALRRFVALRGPVARLRCDRGTNFVGAEGKLNQEEVSKCLATKNCEWVFNPPKAFHFGGIWERLIRTIRRVLDSMFLQLGKHQLTHEVLTTFLAEACAIVNSRPISALSSDPNDARALTPAMLLTLKTEPLEAPLDQFVREDLYGRQRWRRVQYLADQFWIRWRREYLQSLQPRQKWNQSMPNVCKGDVVLLRQKESPRNKWPLARVTEIYPSDDGKVRKADVTVCSDGTRRTYLRPISELTVLVNAPSP